MRLIGHLQNEATARCFSDYLLTQGIDNQIDPEGNGVWKIWVHAEEQIEASQTLWRSYCENPGDPKYQMARQAAHALSVQRKLEQAVAEKKFVDQQRRAGGGPAFGVLTVLLIVASVAVIALTGLNDAARHDSVWLKKLSITEYQIEGRFMQWFKGLPEIKHGQVWRLFTPMFIHFGEMHLLFNMLNLYFLGSALERRQSPWFLALLVLVIGGMSNFGQYLVSGPTFGGMSGVVYGLFGYIWMRNRFDPHYGLHLNKQSVIMIIVWFFLCLFKVIPNVANTAHGVGFGLGMAWGYLSARLANRSAG